MEETFSVTGNLQPGFVKAVIGLGIGLYNTVCGRIQVTSVYASNYLCPLSIHPTFIGAYCQRR